MGVMMQNKDLLRLLRYILLGIAVAAGGVIFSDLCGDFFNGMPYGNAVNLGIGLYLCIVIVVCTGVILKKIK